MRNSSAPSVHVTQRAGSYKARQILGKLLVHVALILICVAASVPFIWMVSTSLKTASAASRTSPALEAVG